MRARCQRVFSESDEAALDESYGARHLQPAWSALTGLAPRISMGGEWDTESQHRNRSYVSEIQCKLFRMIYTIPTQNFPRVSPEPGPPTTAV